jgi:hypothetical protein
LLKKPATCGEKREVRGEKLGIALDSPCLSLLTSHFSLQAAFFSSLLAYVVRRRWSRRPNQWPGRSGRSSLVTEPPVTPLVYAVHLLVLIFAFLSR